MVESTLIAHAGATKVDRATLRGLPTPQPLGPRHHPIPHIELVESLDVAARTRNLFVLREDFAVQRGGDLIFGVMDFRAPFDLLDRPLLPADHDGCLSLGFRHGNDRQLSLQAVCGARVFVCDNLAFSGDLIALQRRHVVGLDLHAEVEAAFDRYLQHARQLANELQRLATTKLSDGHAKIRLFDVFESGALPPTKFPAVARNYFEAADDMTDCQPRTLWGLHNACTRVVRDMKPKPAFEATTMLGRIFGIGTEN